MSIDDVAAELYALVPEEFTAARNARAKVARDAGDRELAAAVQALRKPTTGAWLLNQFVRRHGDVVQQVLALGAQLRAAQGTLGADQLRALDQQRRQLTSAVAQQVRALGLHERRRVTDQVTAAVEETVRSAMVDEAAGAALVTGLLTDTFSATGIDPVDLSRVVALPAAVGAAGAAGAPSAGDSGSGAQVVDLAVARRREEAKKAAAEAESALSAARRAVERADGEAARARERQETLASERDDLRRRLDELEQQVAAARDAAEAATVAAEEARQAEASAAEALGRSREELSTLPG